MNRKTSISAVLVVAALAIGWGVFGGGRSSRAPRDPAPDPAPRAERTAELEPAGSAAPRTSVDAPEAEGVSHAPPSDTNTSSAETLLRLRSSLELPLVRAFYADADGAEHEVAVDADGACRVPREVPFELRAPGYREVVIRTPGDALLEPVLGVIVRAPRLRDRTVVARLSFEAIDGFAEYEDRVACGFPDADRFAVAVDARELPERADQLAYVSLETDDDRLVDLQIRRRVEGTFEHELELADGEPATGRFSEAASCPRGCEPPLERTVWSLARSDERRSWSTDQPWGELVACDWRPRRAVTESDAVRLVAGREYGLGVRCPTCGAYARRFVVAQPGENVVDLVPDEVGVVLTAHLEGDPGSDARVRWNPALAPGRPTEHLAGWGWSGDAPLSVAADGGIRVVLPAAIPMIKECAWPMPPVVRFRITSEEAEPLELWPDVRHGGEIDLGRLVLRSDR